MTVAIVIPTIPPRHGMVLEAVESVLNQAADGVIPIVVQDRRREGAWATRNQGIAHACSMDVDWIGFLDDDDLLLSNHVETLLQVARDHDARVVWSWFDVEGGRDPFPLHRGKPYDPEHPHIFPIPYLVEATAMRQMFHETGGFQADPNGTGNWLIQDWPVVDALWRITEGAFACTPEVTWIWRHHGRNTSGLPGR